MPLTELNSAGNTLHSRKSYCCQSEQTENMLLNKNILYPGLIFSLIYKIFIVSLNTTIL